MEINLLSSELLEKIKNADRKGASMLIEQALVAGIGNEQIIANILDPALEKIGILWGTGHVSLAQGFVGAKIAEDTIIRCLGTLEKSEFCRPKGIAVIGNIEDDFHSLGRRMVISFLSAAGWQVHDLGNDVLAETFIEKALELNATVIGASAMMHTTALNMRKIRDLLDAKNLGTRIKLAVGGAVFNWRPDLVTEVGGDGTAQNAAAVGALFARLQAEVEKDGL